MRIGVTNWLNTALMFYKSAATSVDNHIIRPRVDGGGAANNGVMLESTLRGSIVGARVYNLGRTGAPGYGIQLKNASQYCRVEGGYVENALGGMAFGQDAGTGPSMNLVSDVIAYNCREGLTGGAASNNVVTMRIDMAAAADINQAVRLVLGCTGNDLRVQVDNVTSPKAVVRIDTGSDNRVHVTRVNGVGRPKMYEVLGATSTRNQFRVGTVVGYTGTPFTSSTDAGTGNVAVYEGP